MLGDPDYCEMFADAPLPAEMREGYIWSHRILNCMPAYTTGKGWGITDPSIVNERWKSWCERHEYPYFGEDRPMTEIEAMAFFDERGLPRPYKDGVLYDPHEYVPVREKGDEPWHSDFFGELTPDQAHDIWDRLGLEWQGDGWVMPS
ncbi:MAG: hypothetical protein IKQ60_07135 [Candidatus Methanomethylophilaceae archaeon]|nr:hypothetical protein [Candidatus Methanomethylophilaceae archaeon]